jgi:uncharacterized protein YcbK (DUF882 family)
MRPIPPVKTAVFAATFAGSLALTTASSRPARADVNHVVQRGQTVESIAHRYHVTPQALAQANHLKEGEAVKPGQTLVVAGVTAVAAHPPTEAARRASAAPAHADAHSEPRVRFERDVVRAVRQDEEFRIRVKDGRGKIPSTALKAFERLMRQGDGTHPPDPRLVAVIGTVSNHFGGRTLEVVSGFRAYTPTQYTPDSRHNFGRALDFRIRGIPNEQLRDFCRTLRDTGCGYYPNSTFVHVDVRDTKAYWVDLARPGEPPRYQVQGAVAADEGATEVTPESH